MCNDFCANGIQHNCTAKAFSGEGVPHQLFKQHRGTTGTRPGSWGVSSSWHPHASCTPTGRRTPRAGTPPPFPIRRGPPPPCACTSLGSGKGQGVHLGGVLCLWPSQTVGGLGVGIPRAGPLSSWEPLPRLKPTTQRASVNPRHEKEPINLTSCS